MATLLWLVLGVLLALLAWLLPAGVVVIPLVVLALAIIAILLPREGTSAGAKVAIGFGAFFVVVFGRFLVPDALAAGSAIYVVGGGMLVMAAGLVGVWRNRRRRQRRQEALKAAADLLGG